MSPSWRSPSTSGGAPAVARPSLTPSLTPSLSPTSPTSPAVSLPSSDRASRRRTMLNPFGNRLSQEEETQAEEAKKEINMRYSRYLELSQVASALPPLPSDEIEEREEEEQPQGNTCPERSWQSAALPSISTVTEDPRVSPISEEPPSSPFGDESKINIGDESKTLLNESQMSSISEEPLSSSAEDQPVSPAKEDQFFGSKNLGNTEPTSSISAHSAGSVEDGFSNSRNSLEGSSAVEMESTSRTFHPAPPRPPRLFTDASSLSPSHGQVGFSSSSFTTGGDSETASPTSSAALSPLSGPPVKLVTVAGPTSPVSSHTMESGPRVNSVTKDSRGVRISIVENVDASSDDEDRVIREWKITDSLLDLFNASP